MTNKKFLIGMPVLLIAALFFLGCPSDSEEENPGPSKVTGTALALDLAVGTPVLGEAAKTAVDATQYEGPIAWDKPLVDGKFAASTEYTATVTLTVKDGYTFEGVGTFSHDGGAVSQTETSTGIRVTIVFPITLKADGSKNVADALDLTGLVTKPATGVPAQTDFAGTAQYTGTIAWKDGADAEHTGAFEPNTVYTATVTLVPAEGYTFAGVGAFGHDEATVTQTAGTASGITVTIGFVATAGTAEEPGPVNALNLAGAIAVPVTGAAAGTAFASPDSSQYTGGVVAWTNDLGVAAGSTFAGSTVYKAEVTLTAETGYTFDGLAANAFSYAGASSVVFDPLTGVVTVTFEITAPAVTAVNLTPSITAPETGIAPIYDFTSPDSSQYGDTTVVWTPEIADGEGFAADTPYTARVTLTAEGDYTFATADFVYAGAVATETLNDDGTVTVTVVFGNTAAVVSDLNLSAKFAKPVKNETRAATLDGTQYIGVVAWKAVIGALDTDPIGTQFEAGRNYKAVVTLTPKDGFTFTGFAGSFVYAGASVTAPELNDNGTATVTVTFPEATADSEVTVSFDLDPIRVESSTGSLAGIVLTKGSTETVTLTVVSAASDYQPSNVQWYVDGKSSAVGRAASLVLNPALDYATVRAGAHHVTVKATIGGKVYSQTVAFAVVAGSN
jgi:hypothetical protein